MKCPSVLIVEDDQDIRELCQEFLDNEGFPVDAVSNGKEAMEYLNQNTEPCVILLDMMMPVMDGREFMLALEKRADAIAQIPVYLVSASAEPTEGKSMGCLGFLKKPYDFNDLLSIVRTHCELAMQDRSFSPGFMRVGLRTDLNPKTL